MIEALGSLILTTTLLLGSPGPAPLALAATGAVFGIRGGLPFLGGILTGLLFVIILAATGIAALFEVFPASRVLVQVLGGLYILYVAYRIATAPLVRGSTNSQNKAPRFKDGFIFNLLNAKAYAAFLALFSQFQLPLDNPLAATAITAIVAFMVAIAVDIAWLSLGQLLRPVFESPRLARPIRVFFATLMLLAVAMMFRSG